MEKLNKELEKQLPTPILDSYLVFLEENEDYAFRKVHRLIDLIEVFCKFYTVCTLATFLKELFKKNPNLIENLEAVQKIKLDLVLGFVRPSLGNWWKFSVEISKIFKEFGISHIIPGAEYELTSGIIYDAFQKDKSLINFRNLYAHGATFSEDVCKEHLDIYWPKVLEILIAAESLRKIRLIVCLPSGDFLECKKENLTIVQPLLEPLPGHIWVMDSKNQNVDIFPLLYFKINEDNHLKFFFYNSLEGNNARILNYPFAEHDKILREEFLNRVPLEKWYSLGPFSLTINSLTESFKGRHFELEKIAKFVDSESDQFLCVWGPPGVGKSALLARSVLILRGLSQESSYIDAGDYWPKIKIYVFEYFFNSDDTVKKIFDNIRNRLNEEFKLRIKDEDKRYKDNLLLGIQNISQILKSSDRLLFVFDGLDEVVSNEIINLFPTLLPNNIKIIFGARPKYDLRFTFYSKLNRERRCEFELGGLNFSDINSLLMDYVNKYEINKNHINQILNISKGNSLYLKLLCKRLESKEIKINQIEELPSEITDIYEKSLSKLSFQFPGTVNFLLFFVASKDYLSPELIAEWMKSTSSHVINNFLNPCLEFLTRTILYLDEHDQPVVGYRLFHESLREYLQGKYRGEILEIKELISDWCLKWASENGDPFFENDRLAYSMRFTTDYLYESYCYHIKYKRIEKAKKRESQLLSLLNNEKWKSLNFETCGNGEGISNGYNYLQLIIARNDIFGEQLSDFLEYSINRIIVPSAQYLKLRDLLKQSVKRNQQSDHLFKTASVTKIGKSEEYKLLLAIMPFWYNKINSDKIPPILNDQIEKWVENSKTTAYKKLWNFTKKRIIIHDY
jgi:hypothetical protein